jgi:hypothetical protein
MALIEAPAPLSRIEPPIPDGLLPFMTCAQSGAEKVLAATAATAAIAAVPPWE